MSTNYRYSEAFKQQVIMEIESGRFASANEASQAYGIKGHTTVSNWLRQTGRGELVRKVVRVEKPGEPGEIRRLKERVRKLETALANAHMDGALTESFFEILCEQSGIDPAEFKKKHGAKESAGRGKSSRGRKG